MGSQQTFSHYPTWPLPVLGVQGVTVSGKQVCGYLEGKLSTFRAFEVVEATRDGEPGMTGLEYQRFMDAGFRRSGTIVYQPMCKGCRACVPLRVPVDDFVPSKSQRRVLRKNPDITVRVGTPEPTREKWDMYERYQREWHGKRGGEEDIMSFMQFLYRSPVETVEMEYRDKWDKLLAVGICDLCPESLSSVYFYFDPRSAQRSLGTFGALHEIEWARRMKLKYWYAGYWIKGCGSMEYKARFRPCEVLGTDGLWRKLGEECVPGRQSVSGGQRTGI